MIKLNFKNMYMLRQMVADDFTRVYLNYINCTPDGYMTATDGTLLATFKAPADECELKEPMLFDIVKFIKSNNITATVIKKFNDKVFLTVDDAGHIDLTRPDGLVLLSAIGNISDYNKSEEWTYPEWKKVFPSIDSVKISYSPLETYPIDLKQLSRFSEFKDVRLVGNNTGSPFLVFTSNPNFLGLIMPLKSDKLEVAGNLIFEELVK